MKNEENKQTLPKALAFDLDGTLAPSKSHLESDMAEVFSSLLNYLPMAVVSGASKEQFLRQFINYLSQDRTNFTNLYIFPENGASLEIHKEGIWILQYENRFNEQESEKIVSTLNRVIAMNNLSRDLGYGDLVENRGSQITLSALGQKAPLELKEKWDPDQAVRKRIKAFLDPLLPECEIRIGGTTSIDITKKGQNKAVAINNLIKLLKIDKSELIFFGDALYPGGNDEIVKETEVKCHQVSNPQDTIAQLRDILHMYEEANRQSSLG